jgi:YVTN family beta-propeller protein
MRIAICYAAFLAFSLSTFAVDSPAAQPAAPYAVTKTFPIGGEGRWDYLTVDPAAKLLYVPRQTHTQVISAETGKVIGDVKDTPGVHGCAVVPDLNRGFTSNGQAKSITIFDLKTIAPLGTTRAGDNPDAIVYEPFSKKIFAFNGRSKDATVIDASAAPGAPAVATIPLGGKPEFAASDEAGHLYVNIEDTNSVAVIDTKTLKVSDTWKIDGGEEPSGMAIDIIHHRIFLGCGGNRVMAVIDTQTGKTVGTVPIGKGVDACAFDPGTGEAFASCGDGTLTVARETSPGKFEVVQTVQTRAGARTMGLDPTTHTIYLSTADFGAAAPGERRPPMKPNSFMILVVSRQEK